MSFIVPFAIYIRLASNSYTIEHGEQSGLPLDEDRKSATGRMAVEMSTNSGRSFELGLTAFIRNFDLIIFLGITLGILIEPAQIRLKPDPQDGYLWSVLPERRHLFTKQLSKHSVGAYMELYREVGKSFEAVAQTTSDNLVGDETEVGPKHFLISAPTLTHRSLSHLITQILAFLPKYVACRRIILG